MKSLITGGCGFVGSNIAARIASEGGEVAILDNLSRAGASLNLEWLRSLAPLKFFHADIRNAHEVEETVRQTEPDVIFHLAGQVAMTTSVQDPRKDFEINVCGTINVLEAARRHAPEAAIIYSSSNKAYGDLGRVALVERATRYEAPEFPRGISEDMPLDFHTPYGCSKGAADQYVLDYARTFGMNNVVFRHSTIYGARQFATFDQGWVGWFCQQALEKKRNPDAAPFTIAGDGKQVRDLLHIDDAVACYLAAARAIAKARGQAFNIGGGIANSCSLLELFHLLEDLLGIQLQFEKLPWRHDDQKFFVADHAKATAVMDWSPAVGRDQGIKKAVEWTTERLR
ncbi:MAG TPA: SDR family NAD(P)-dependent oxidoreductase [Terrimicrobiaceae bacterium]|nr:SDR family NAD(P)-dependent oxidoreductase [Terrimicrobiaceae bacterium]